MTRLITIISIANGIMPEVDLNRLGYAVTGYGMSDRYVKDWD
jgi:hypothetical protein